jgi:uncharacterized cupin superfamily protein
MMTDAASMTIDSIVPIVPDPAKGFVPPLSDYKILSADWVEKEFHCADVATDRVTVGFWTGEPGHIVLDPWRYTEVCSILTGRVAIVDRQGGRREFGPGDGFVVPKGFIGEWLTLEPSSKIFLAIY